MGPAKADGLGANDKTTNDEPSGSGGAGQPAMDKLREPIDWPPEQLLLVYVPLVCVCASVCVSVCGKAAHLINGARWSPLASKLLQLAVD